MRVRKKGENKKKKNTSPYISHVPALPKMQLFQHVSTAPFPGAVAVADAAVALGDTSFPSRKALASATVTVLVT